MKQDFVGFGQGRVLVGFALWTKRKLLHEMFHHSRVRKAGHIRWGWLFPTILFSFFLRHCMAPLGICNELLEWINPCR